MMNVRNTFIEVPPTPGASAAHSVPTPLATAPANMTYTLKDSLIAAAATDAPPGSFSQRRGMKMAEGLKLQYAPAQSGVSMIAIPESPSVARTLAMSTAPAPVVITPTPMGSSSIPPTPAMQWAVTPTGTPAYYSMPQVAQTPWGGDHKTTLSLTSMIQSPKAEEKHMMINQAYQQYQQYYQAAPGQYTTLAAAPGQAAPQYTVVQGQPQYAVMQGQPQVAAPQYQVISQPPPSTPTIAGQYQVAQPPPPPPQEAGEASPSDAAATSDEGESPKQPDAASVLLGLVNPGQGAPPVAPAQANFRQPVYTQQGPVTYMMPQQAPVAMLSPAMMSGSSGTGSPTQTFTGSPTQQIQYVMPPRPQYVQQGMAMTQPQHFQTVMQAPAQRFVPPPPMQAAPTVVMSPKGAPPMGVAGMMQAQPLVYSAKPASPAAISEDLQVLMQMAAASGNQGAMDAARRQGQQAGLTPEQIDAMMSG
jgi:hypothetical protein